MFASAIIPGRTDMNSKNQTKVQIEQLQLAKLWTILGAVVMSVVLVAGVIGGLYWLVSSLSVSTLRLLCVGLILILPASIALTWILALGQAKSHLGGFERGLDAGQKALETMGKGLSATVSAQRLDARSLKQTQAISANQNYDDLLPRPGSMQISVMDDRRGEILDL